MSKKVSQKVIWKPQIKKHESVTPQAYKIIYEQGLQRFEECASESESITDKTIKLFTAMIALGSFFAGVSFTHNVYFDNWVLLVLAICYVANLGILFLLMSPRSIYHRGLEPKIFFPTELDEEPPNEQESIVYYQGICILQDKIESFYTLLSKRIFWYKVSIVGSFILLVVSIYFTGKTISHS